MNVLVTGGAGYLGAVLIPKLVARGHNVRVLDLGYFGVGHLRSYRKPIELYREDMRRLLDDPSFADELLDGVECVIHLAAISNDPSAELNPDLTNEVNFLSTVALAERAKRRGIHFVFSSSCSVYGEADGEIDETGTLNPLTAYAISKVNCERALEDLMDDTWRPVVLRNGTLFGFSPRMRFDLVVNIFSLYSAIHNEIKVFGDGLQWRPFLHVDDCARALVFLAERGSARQHFCYNVSHVNARVVDIAGIFVELNPHLKVTHLSTQDIDRRDYRVSTHRMIDEGFATRIDISVGAESMIGAIVSGAIPDPESVYYRNAKWLHELTQLGSRPHRDIVGMMEALVNVRQG